MMADVSDSFPPDVRRFILENLNSIDQLEMLLLLRNEPQRVWRPEEVSAELYTHPDAAQQRLKDLVNTKAVIEDESGAYRYHPMTAEMAQTIDSLEQLYKRRRVTVINLIYSKSAPGVQAFADAFQLRKDKK